MRTIRFYVVNKNTRKAIFTDCRKSKCETFLENLENKEDYAIGYKFLSI